MTTKPQLVGILAPINEGGGGVTETKDKNGRKRKKEGLLAMAKWIRCAVNVSSWHTRGPGKGASPSISLLPVPPHHTQGQCCAAREDEAFPLFLGGRENQLPKSRLQQCQEIPKKC